MGKAKHYYISGEPFETKTALMTKIRKILNAYDLYESIDHLDFQFMLEILKLHYRASEKIGVGVTSIRIEPDGLHGTTRCFVLLRADGKSTDFSYKKCLDGRKSELSLFKEAARNAIAEQIINFKNRAFEECGAGGAILCPIKQILVTKSESHVDHEPPLTFDAIVSSFISENGIDVKKVNYVGYGDHCYTKKFSDSTLTEKFSQYHKNRAKLRITSKPGNLSQKKKSF